MRVLPFLRDGIWYAIFALSINTAGYTGEILRGAILAVPHGEIEAGKAFGMSKLEDLPPHHAAACDSHLPADDEHGNDPAAEGDVAGVDRHGLRSAGHGAVHPAADLPDLRDADRRGIVYIVLVFILTRILNWLERYLNKDRERPVSIPLAQTAKP